MMLSADICREYFDKGDCRIGNILAKIEKDENRAPVDDRRTNLIYENL